METQCQPNILPAHTSASPSFRKPLVTKSSRRNSTVIAERGTIPQLGDHNDQQELKREPERQALFRNAANKALHLPNGYLKVAVLIIRWDETIDDFKGHTKEVSTALPIPPHISADPSLQIKRLQKIFEDKFNYHCTIFSISGSKKPQVDLNWAIMNHVREHDGPNTLLIFFYTGHGDESGMDELGLSA